MRASSDTASVLAGCAQWNISPPAGSHTLLSGYPDLDRWSQGIHDPLIGSMIVLDDGRTQLALVALDVIGLPRVLARRLQAAIARAVHTQPDHVMVSATHTHSAPDVGFMSLAAFRSPDHQAVAAYQDQLVQQAGAAAARANAARQPAYLGCRVVYAEGCGGNRLEPNGPSDPAIGVIGLRDGGGQWLACWVNYAMHPTVLHADNRLISADFPGSVRRHLARALGPAPTLVYTNGAEGDQSTRFWRRGQSFEEVERIGAGIGQKVVEALQGMECRPVGRLAAACQQFEAVRRPMPTSAAADELAAAATARLEALRVAAAPYPEQRTAEVAVIGAQALAAYSRDQGTDSVWERLKTEMPAKVQLLSLGDIRLVALPGEFFVAYGLAIKSASPCAQTFVVGLANGALPGYVVTAAAAKAGGYEAANAVLAPATGAWAVAAALELLAAG